MKLDELLREMVRRLLNALEDDLEAVVLYGPAAHGDHYAEVGDMNLLVVTSDLEPDTLHRLGDPVRWWLRHDQPWPRLFTPELIREAVDVFPIEILDITRHHRVVHGRSPLASIDIVPGLLRLQCERELREKLMRLHEGYVECRGKRRPLGRLLAASYASLAPVWRACLHLLGIEAPVHDRDAAAAACQWLQLDRVPFDRVALVAAGAGKADAVLFARYCRAIGMAIHRIDRLLEPPRAHATAVFHS